MKKRNLKKSNHKGCGVLTVVRGIRAEQCFFDKCDEIAVLEDTNRNELIVRIVKDYCEVNYGNK
jgi:predicted DNA-binding ribbon-helix-helix protein